MQDDLDFAPVHNGKDQEQFPCHMCNGTGLYRGVRIHQEKEHCFACRGRGYFLTSPEKRANDKKKRQERKQKEVIRKADLRNRARKEWIEQNREVYDFMVANANWNEFCQNMLTALDSYGGLTERQLETVVKIKIKCEQRKVERAKADAEKPVVDLIEIRKLFDNAQANGLKKPILRIGELKLSLAPMHGRNAGCIYVKDNGEYAGKLTQEGKWYGIRGAREAIQGELIELASNPLEQAVAYGRRTGSCSCCGRTLTKTESIEKGIGPICAEKWGL